MMPNPTGPQAVQDCHRCLLWMIPTIDKFPRQRRFTLGEKLESRLLLLLELLTEATYQKSNKTLLKKANNQVAVSRHLWRLAFELGVVSGKRYEHGSMLLVNLGRQIGGWSKQVETPG